MIACLTVRLDLVDTEGIQRQQFFSAFFTFAFEDKERGLCQGKTKNLEHSGHHSQVACALFRFAHFNTSPLYYLRAWHRLPSSLPPCQPGVTTDESFVFRF